MEFLIVLVPLSVMLMLLVVGVLWWAIDTGQIDAEEAEGARILDQP